MDANIYRILYEVENNIQWIATTSYNYTFEEYTKKTDTPTELAKAFIINYERPKEIDQPIRGEQAEYWYTFLGGITPSPISPSNKKGKFNWAIYTNKLRRKYL